MCLLVSRAGLLLNLPCNLENLPVLPLLLPALTGKVLAEAMAGTAARFDVLAGLAPPEFPGGAALRSPLYVLGMLWYALRDRL